jgi:hypothetical protein
MAERPSNGTERLRLSAPGRARRRRELVVGLILVAFGALGALVAATSGRDRVPVVSLSDDVERGEVIDESDLTLTYIEANRSVAYVDEAARSDLVGQAALLDMPAGAIVTIGQFGPPTAVTAAGQGTVGLSLEPGQLPALPLSAGDRVSVVGGSGSGGAGGVRPGQLVAGSEVVSAERVDDQSESWWVSLRTGEADAVALATAAANGTRLQLVLVGR